MLYQVVNNAKAKVAVEYTPGDGSLTLDDGSSFGSPTEENPILFSTFAADGTPYGIYTAIGRSSNNLTGMTLVSGIDNALAINDLVEIRWTAEHVNQIISFFSGLNTTISGEGAHAEGDSTEASGYVAHAEGEYTVSSGEAAHAEGNQTIASNQASHAEGDSSEASGYASHAEGDATQASNDCAHAEGDSTIASGFSSHTEGYGAVASGNYCHAEGYSTIASLDEAHSQGEYTIAGGFASHAEGTYTNSLGYGSHSEGSNTIALGNNSHAEGNYVMALGVASHAEGSYTLATGEGSHAEGFHSSVVKDDLLDFTLDGLNLVISGQNVTARFNPTGSLLGLINLYGGSGPTAATASYYSVTFSDPDTIISLYSSVTSHTGGQLYNLATAPQYAHAEGSYTQASANNSHAAGYFALASLPTQHTYSDGGFGTLGSGQHSHIQLTAQTTNNTPTVLSINQVDPLLIRTNFTVGCYIHIVARKTDGSAHAYFIRQCLISNEAGVTALVGSVTTVGTDNNTPGWTIAITADDSLKITVTGAAATTIRWVAVIFPMVEVGS